MTCDDRDTGGDASDDTSSGNSDYILD